MIWQHRLYTNTPVCVASIWVVSKLSRLKTAVPWKLRRFCFDLRRFFPLNSVFLTNSDEFLCACKLNFVIKMIKIPILTYNVQIKTKMNCKKQYFVLKNWIFLVKIPVNGTN